MEINKNFIFILLIAIVFWSVLSYSKEGFSSDMTEFVHLGNPRYGLRGDKLRRSSIERLFIRPDRRILLNHAGGEMWVANRNPTKQGMSGCNKINCPENDEYDNIDNCFDCQKSNFVKSGLPILHSH